LIKDGKIVRPYLGISYSSLQTYSPQMRKSAGITVDGDNGAVVGAIRRGSPAAAAGLQVNDVILKANGQNISDVDQLNTIIQSLKVGDALNLVINRDGDTQSVSVTLRERPQDFDQQMRQMRTPRPAPYQAPDQGDDQQSPF